MVINSLKMILKIGYQWVLNTYDHYVLIWNFKNIGTYLRFCVKILICKYFKSYC